jgi:putative ABC transport system substrate-binding protein
MRRRDFIAGLAGSAAGWPLAAPAQQAKKPSRIGYLGPSSPSLERAQVDTLRKALGELGYVEGQDIAFEFQWAEGNDSRLPKLADELVRHKPDVIVTTGTPGTLAAKRATRTIPIVFASSGNPVNAGLVASYAQPGGNVTGFTVLGPELEGKRMQLLKEIVRDASRVAMIWNSANPAILDFYHQTRAAAAALNLTLQPIVEIRHPDVFNAAFATIADAKPHAMIVLVDRFLLAHRTEIVNFAAASRVPTMYGYRSYVDAGGLMSYAPNDLNQYRRTAGYVDKILHGAKPAELPVQEPTKFELVINLKAAKALGLDVPLQIQQIADEVIE